MTVRVGRRTLATGSGPLFHPRGLAGHAYWWGVAPFHAVVFGGMARNIAAKAEATARDRP